MIHELPARALFRFELQIPRLKQPPKIDGDVRKWTAKHSTAGDRVDVLE